MNASPQIDRNVVGGGKRGRGIQKHKNASAAAQLDKAQGLMDRDAKDTGTTNNTINIIAGDVADALARLAELQRRLP